MTAISNIDQIICISLYPNRGLTKSIYFKIVIIPVHTRIYGVVKHIGTIIPDGAQNIVKRIKKFKAVENVYLLSRFIRTVHTISQMIIDLSISLHIRLMRCYITNWYKANKLPREKRIRFVDINLYNPFKYLTTRVGLSLWRI